MIAARRTPLVLASLCLALILLARPLAGDDPQATKTAWSFPSTFEPGKRYDYLVSCSVDLQENGQPRHFEQQATFTVCVSRAKDKPGCILRLCEVAKPFESGLASFLDGFVDKEGTDAGLRITPDEVFFREGPLLRGPWKRGDRFSMFTFLSLLFARQIGVSHLEVRSADAAEVHLDSDFWMGESGPQVTGEGSVIFVKDGRGLTRVRIDSHWSGEGLRCKLSALIERKRIYEPSAATQPAATTQPGEAD